VDKSVAAVFRNQVSEKKKNHPRKRKHGAGSVPSEPNQGRCKLPEKMAGQGGTTRCRQKKRQCNHVGNNRHTGGPTEGKKKKLPTENTWGWGKGGEGGNFGSKKRKNGQTLERPTCSLVKGDQRTVTLGKGGTRCWKKEKTREKQTNANKKKGRNVTQEDQSNGKTIYAAVLFYGGGEGLGVTPFVRDKPVNKTDSVFAPGTSPQVYQLKTKRTYLISLLSGGRAR